MRILSLLALAAITLSANAALNQTSVKWFSLLDATAPDMGIDMTMADGSLYYLSCVGSVVGNGDTGQDHGYTDPTASIYYNNTRVATGAAYQGAGYNNNFNLLKTDLNGQFLWNVYSTSGEISSNNGGVVPAADGGVYVACVIRHTDNLRTEPIRFTDATGEVTTIDWRLPSQEHKRWWQGLLMKVSADGEILWHRLISVSNAPQPDATGEADQLTTSAFFISGMEADGQGNFYLAGRYVNPVTFDTPSATLTLTPHNTAGWDGDAQKTRGDLFVVKLNSEGQLTGSLTTTGRAYAESSPVIFRTGSDLIVNAMVTGTDDGDCAITLDGQTLALPDGNQSMITARVGADLSVKWVRLFRGAPVSTRSSVLQSNCINVVGNAVYLTGQGNFSLTDDTGQHTIATSTGNIREGYIIKLDAVTGDWLAATLSKTGALAGLNGIACYSGGFEDNDGHFYAYGYTFAADTSTPEYFSYGVVLAAHDATTLEPAERVSLISRGSMSTSQTFIARGNMLYTLSRGRDSGMETYALLPIGGEQTYATRNWAVLCGAFELPFEVKTADAPALTGDVDNDGKVDVADIGILVNILLGKDEAARYDGRANVDGQGGVDVADINAVIAIITGK